MEALIDIRKVSKTYITGSFRVDALKDVSIRITSGEMVALAGPSGSGKSTLLHIMGFLDKPDAGEYYFAGHPGEPERRPAGRYPQQNGGIYIPILPPVKKDYRKRQRASAYGLQRPGRGPEKGSGMPQAGGAVRPGQT